MKVLADYSYNLDLLCFLNVLTNDDYYVKRYREEYEQFYPLLRDETKTKLIDVVHSLGTPMLSPGFTLIISCLRDFASRDIYEILQAHDDIRHQMAFTPYNAPDEKYTEYFSYFEKIIPVIQEIEELGFKKFWNETRFPMIREKCTELNNYFTSYNLKDYMKEYKPDDDKDIVVYLCSFAKPHAIKICGNNLVSDYSYKNETILANVTHEMFHPPYKYEKVKTYIDILASKTWVVDAFRNQDPMSGYNEMDGFIEENIVEALGTYIVYQLSVEKQPFEYFKQHDGGSHVISPYFFKFLMSHKRRENQSMEDYFIEFVKMIDEIECYEFKN